MTPAEPAIYHDHDVMWQVAQQFGMDRFDFENIWAQFEANNIECAAQVSMFETQAIFKAVRELWP